MIVLQDFRKMLGLTQREAAQLLMINRSTISMIECGLRRTPVEVFLRINRIADNLKEDTEATAYMEEVKAAQRQKAEQELQRKILIMRWNKEQNAKRLARMERKATAAANMLKFLVREMNIFAMDKCYMNELIVWHYQAKEKFLSALPDCQERLKARMRMATESIPVLCDQLRTVYRVEPIAWGS